MKETNSDLVRVPLRQRTKRFFELTFEFGLKKAINEAIGSIKYHSYEKEGFYKNYLRVRSENGLLQKDIKGNKLWLDIYDPGISLRLLAYGVHEEKITNRWRRVIDKNMTVIDIGGNLGYYTLMAADATGPHGIVYSFEPVSYNYNLLRKNIKSNKYSNIKTFNKVVSDTVGTEKMNLTPQSNLGTIITSTDNGEVSDNYKQRIRDRTEEIEEIGSVTIDDFIKSQEISDFDVLRMDIEGGELKVVRGMEYTLDVVSSPCTIFIETHPDVFKDPKQSLTEIFTPFFESGFVPEEVLTPNETIDDISQNELVDIICQYQVISPHVILKK